MSTPKIFSKTLDKAIEALALKEKKDRIEKFVKEVGTAFAENPRTIVLHMVAYGGVLAIMYFLFYNIFIQNKDSTIEKKDSTIERLEQEKNALIQEQATRVIALEQEIDELKQEDSESKITTKLSIYEERIKLYIEKTSFYKDKLQECRLDLSKAASEVIAKIDRSVATKNYRVEKIKSTETIHGQIGKYYLIDIIDSDKSKIINFPAGKYVINNFHSKFSESLSRFFEEIIKPISKSVSFSIYIEGSADKAGDRIFSSKFDKKYKYETIKLYSKAYGTKTQFLPRIDEISITEPFTNIDLPNLRARFVQNMLENSYNFKPIILDGNVTSKVDAKDRNVSIYLYVDN